MEDTNNILPNSIIVTLEEFRFKNWLDNHAYEFMTELGIKAGQVVLDFGTGAYTISSSN